jgi:penicillin-binding protein 2
MPLRQLIDDDQVTRSRRSVILAVVITSLFSLIVICFYYIQIFQYSKYIKLSKENMMNLKIVRSQRGRIFDRQGRILVRNRPSYSIAVIPIRLSRKIQGNVVDKLMRIRFSNGDPAFKNRDDLNYAINLARRRPFSETRLLEDIPFDLVSVIEEHSGDLPGIIIATETRREYPHGSLAAHILGYLGEIPENKFDSLKAMGYSYGDHMGVFGLEKMYEQKFRGKKGSKYIMVNAFGREFDVIKDMPSTPPINGEDVYLTIDLDLQKAAEQAFPDTNRGAVVAMDPNNGEILCMLSSPGLNPNVFTFSKEKLQREWRKMSRNPDRPLNNRATMGTYEPGSTFKIATAIAGLNDSLVTGRTTFKPCKGGYWAGRNYFKKCWNWRGHGRMNVTGSIRQSCDVYFYQLGLKVGTGPLNRYARMLGLGKPTGIDLPQEKSGELMDSAYYVKKFKKKIAENPKWAWSRGLILNYAIGQGELVTPLQLANYTAGLANGRVIYTPHLLKYTVDHQQTRHDNELKVLGAIEISDTVLSIIRNAMQEVVNSPYGTAPKARIEGVTVGGKTGTSENPHGRDHALFIAFAPVEEPRIVIAVIVENAPGGGGAYAAPIAGKILKEFFKHETST